MLNKFQFLKRISSSFSMSRNHSFPSLSPKFPLQALNLSNHYHNYSFSTSSPHLLKPLDLESEISKSLEKYAAHKEDLTKLTSEEIRKLLSDLSGLSRSQILPRDDLRTEDCLILRDEIFKKLGIKDTIEVAQNSYDLASILIFNYQFEAAEKYLSEIDRICQLHGEDPQARSLRVQRSFLLAFIESYESDDKALKLYEALLKNVGDVDESVKPGFLARVHFEMGKLKRLNEKASGMTVNFRKSLEAAIQNYGEKSTLSAFDFLKTVQPNPYLKNFANSFSDPYEKGAIMCCVLGNIYFTHLDYRQASNSYMEAFRLLDGVDKDYSSLLHEAYFTMAWASVWLGHSIMYFDVVNYLEKAKKGLITANGEPNLKVAETYERWAEKLLEHPDLPAEAAKYYREALELYKIHDPENKDKIFSIYEKLGEIAMGSQYGFVEEEWNKALEIWQEAELFLNPNDHARVQRLNITLEFLHYEHGNIQQSEKCVEKILQSCRKTGDTSYAFSAYYESGKELEEKGDFKEALKCYEIASRIYEKEANKDPAKTQNLTAKISKIKGKL